jgi:hypothetical protein
MSALFTLSGNPVQFVAMLPTAWSASGNCEACKEVIWGYPRPTAVGCAGTCGCGHRTEWVSVFLTGHYFTAWQVGD